VLRNYAATKGGKGEGECNFGYLKWHFIVLERADSDCRPPLCKSDLFYSQPYIRVYVSFLSTACLSHNRASALCKILTDLCYVLQLPSLYKCIYNITHRYWAGNKIVIENVKREIDFCKWNHRSGCQEVSCPLRNLKLLQNVCSILAILVYPLTRD
jgi:hypothetical protein